MDISRLHRFAIATCLLFPLHTSLALTATAISNDQAANSNSAIFTLRQSFYHSVTGLDDVEFVTQHHSGLGNPAAESEDNSHKRGLNLRYASLPTRHADSTGHQGSQQQVIDSSEYHIQAFEQTRPNITDKETIVNLAKMTSDAYYRDPTVPGWLNLTDGFNSSNPFGWKKNGLRGQVFANADNSTVIVSFKGTSTYPSEETYKLDRQNDNVLFSCCCATQKQYSYIYTPICDCRKSTYVCNTNCLSDECGKDDRYYKTAAKIVQNVSAVYPHAQLWMVGHSLGGALASLMGMTFHLPVVTFESPPERLPARRLGLDTTSDRYIPAYHFGNTADPIYQGACDGYTASCSLAGYAFESQCFTGKRCIYDTVTDKGWRLFINNHRIARVIPEILEKYPTVPTCEDEDEECAECANWYFVDT